MFTLDGSSRFTAETAMRLGGWYHAIA